MTKVPLNVTVPGGPHLDGDGPSPDGQVFNQTHRFVISSKAGRGPALFIEVAGVPDRWGIPASFKIGADVVRSRVRSTRSLRPGST